MLVSLKISNIALIEDVEIQFDRGLNILSGETGAGKSIILDSIALISGEHARVDLIRTGEDVAKILAIFYIDDTPHLQKHLEELGISTKENLLIIERQIFRDKRPSLAFVNHNRMLVGELKKIGQMLLDIHSQHENQALFDIHQHLSILDTYGNIQPLVKEYQKDFQRALDIKKHIAELEKLKSQKEEEENFIRYQWEELQKAQLDPDEWEELHTFLESLEHQQQRSSDLQRIYGILYEQEDAAVINQLQEILFLLERRFGDETNFQEIKNHLQEAFVKVQEAAEFIRETKSYGEFSEEDLVAKHQRHEFLQELQNKYRKDIPELQAFQIDLEDRLTQVDKIQDEIHTLEQERGVLRKILIEKALEISSHRKKEARKLIDTVSQELAQLHLLHTEFDIEFISMEDEKGTVLLPDGRHVHLLKDGIEKVQFLVSFNPGEEKKSLAKIGSGGEVGRFMLVLKKILGQLSSTTTQIFDEIDTGIGGETAFAVGKKILEIATHRQVICITHLPQIAAMGQLQYLVTKTTQNGRTKTEIVLLSKEQRIAEISRMLSGDSLSEVSLEHAKELLGYKNP